MNRLTNVLPEITHVDQSYTKYVQHSPAYRDDISFGFGDIYK